MTDALPEDFDPEDGVTDGLLDKCAVCDVIFTGNGGLDGSVFDQQGRKYDHILDTDAEDRPFFCEDCWPILEANQKAAENQSLEHFA